MSKLFRFSLFTFVASLGLASAAFAQGNIQGDVKGVDGRPARGAEVQITSTAKRGQTTVVRTDGRGRFTTGNLPAGTYNVMAKAEGGVTSPMQAIRVTTQPVMVNFDMRESNARKTATGHKKKKKMVWVPDTTGSHLGGRFVEVDEDATDAPNAQNVERASVKSLERVQNSGVNRGMNSGSR